MSLQDTLRNYGGSVAAASRYVGTFASGAAMAVGVLGLGAIDPQQVERLFQSFQDLGTAVANALTAVSTIVGIVLGAYGAWKASRTQQVKAVEKIPDVTVLVDVSPASRAPAAVQALAADPAVADVVPLKGKP